MDVVITDTEQWGIYTQTLAPAFDVDSLLDVHYAAKTKVSLFPVEHGSFVDYNKIQEPYIVKLRLAVGGDSARMTTFLDALQTAKNSVTLFYVITPEMWYQNATIISFDYKRTQASGRNLIIADVSLVEVREVSLQYAATSIKAGVAKKKDAESKLAAGKQQAAASPSTWAKLKGLSPEQVKAQAFADDAVERAAKQKLLSSLGL